MTKEELFFLCVLSGASEIPGVENPVDEMNEVQVHSKWQEVSKQLYEKEYIYDDEEGRMVISDSYAQMAAIVSFPDIVYATRTVEEDVTHMIYIRGQKGVYIMNYVEEHEVHFIDNQEELLAFLQEYFLLSETKHEAGIMTSIEKMNQAISLLSEGDIEKALETLNIDDENIINGEKALSVFLDYPDQREFIGRRINQETPSEALFKTVRTDEGTWLFKMNKEHASILKMSSEKLLEEILYF